MSKMNASEDQMKRPQILIKRDERLVNAVRNDVKTGADMSTLFEKIAKTRDLLRANTAVVLGVPWRKRDGCAIKER